MNRKIVLLLSIICFTLYGCGAKTYKGNIREDVKKAKTTLSYNGNTDFNKIDTVKFGKYYKNNYFEKEDIEWFVVKRNDKGALLLSKYVLDALPMGKNDNTTWATSDIRYYLNNNFYNEAFTDEEKNVIATAFVNNFDYATEYNDYSSKAKWVAMVKNSPNTYDKVFIRNYRQSYFNSVKVKLPNSESGKNTNNWLNSFFKKKYLTNYSFSDKNIPTEFAKSKGLEVQNYDNFNDFESMNYYFWKKFNGCCKPWTREKDTPNSFIVTNINGSRTVHREDYNNLQKIYGIRPMIWIQYNDNESLYSGYIDNKFYANDEVLSYTWYNDNVYEYYLGKGGIPLTNQWKDNRYLDNNGIVMKNTVTPDGKTVNEDGIDITRIKSNIGYVLRDNHFYINNELQVDKWIYYIVHYYHVDGYGNIDKNKWVEGRYLGNDGRMLTATKTPDGKYVDAEGYEVKDLNKDLFDSTLEKEIEADAWYKTKSGLWYYFENDRTTTKKGWFTDDRDNQTYYLDPFTGIMQVGYLDIEGSLYYFNESYDNEPNWYEIGDGIYESYGKKVKSYGSMFRDEETPNGEKVDSNGKIINSSFLSDNNTLSQNSKFYDQIANTELLSEYSVDTRVDQMKTIKFGSFPQNNSNGNIKEPIEWIVIDKQGNKALLLSKKILINKSYNDKLEKVVWEKSSLRQWLNTSFYNEAFNDEEKNQIVNSKIENNNNIEKGLNSPNGNFDVNIDAGNDTEDKIFILSKDEVLKYFSHGERWSGPTVGYYLYKNALSLCSENIGEFSVSIGPGKYKSFNERPWWTRTPGFSEGYNAIVGISFDSDDNDANAILQMSNEVTDDSVGVRPAIWVTY